MIVAGLIGLITLIFFGGGTDYFLVDDLQSSVKKVVFEKDRKKEILSDLSDIEKDIKSYQKVNKKEFKDFLLLYQSQGTDKEELLKSFDKIQEKRLNFQSEIADARIKTLANLTSNEWDQVIENSASAIDKKEKKAAKKKESDNEYFPSTFKAISKHVQDTDQQTILKNSLTNLINTLNKFGANLAELNSKENSIVANKNATREELLQIATEFNELRYSGMEQLLLFHDDIKDHTSDEEWKRIIKTFSKELKSYVQ